MDRKDAEQLTNDTLITDLIIRVKSLESLLIKKKLISETEFQDEMQNIIDILSVSILEKSQVKGDLNKIVESLKK